MKRLFFLAPLCIIIGTLLACGESTNNTGTTNGKNTPAATPAAHFKVGDNVTVGSIWKATVNSITTNPGDDFSKPQKGAFVVINISLTNVSNAEQNISSLLNFNFTGPDGTEYTEAYINSAA